MLRPAATCTEIVAAAAHRKWANNRGGARQAPAAGAVPPGLAPLQLEEGPGGTDDAAIACKGAMGK